METDCEYNYRLMMDGDKGAFCFLLSVLNIMAYDDDTKAVLEWFLTWDILEDAMPFLIQPTGIYVVGGYDGSNRLDSVLCYDTTTNTWSGVASMPTGRYSHGVCVHGNFIYVIGGYDGSNVLDSVLCYDTTTTTWNGVGARVLF